MRHLPFILLGAVLVALSVTARASAEPARHGVKAPALSAKNATETVTITGGPHA